MSYKLNDRVKNEIKIEFDVSTKDWLEAIDEAYNKNKSKYSFEGFRKGKVPKKILEQAYGTSLFFEDAIDIILPKYYYEALDKEKLEDVDQPKIDIVAVSDSTLKFNAIVTLKPIVKLGKYTNIEIEKEEVKVSKEEIDEEINAELDKAGYWEDISDRACKMGDTVDIDFEGSVDGVKFDGGTAKNYSLVLGTHSFIDNFEEQICGMKIGETKDIIVTFPKEYQEESLAGKKSLFVTKLNAIKTKITPKLDDEFVKDVSEFDTLKDYKKSIQDRIAKEKEHHAQRELENKLVDKIIETVEVDIPSCMIDKQIEQNIQEFESRMTQQGLKIEDYYKYTNSKREDLKDRYKETAAKSVKIQLVLETLIKKEKIQATDKEIDEKLDDFAKGANISKDEYLKAVPQIKDYLANMVVTDKLFDFLLKNNKIVTKGAKKETKTAKDTAEKKEKSQPKK